MDRGFRVLVADLSRGAVREERYGERKRWLGGSGLAAALFELYGHPAGDPFHPDQPLVFAVGPLTGAFPMMSKSVLGFQSPYHGQYAESHAGGEFALALRFAGFEALVVTGRAQGSSCLAISSQGAGFRDVSALSGAGVFAAARGLRKEAFRDPGHLSVLCIGPAGENLCAFAGINVDAHRHFGRLGAGAAMGAKNLKGVVVRGDGHLDLEPSLRSGYGRVFDAISSGVFGSREVQKYAHLGTARNLADLNAMRALPWRNLRKTADQGAERISAERLAERTLVRRAACAGCPVGCIHIGSAGERPDGASERFAPGVAYDFEPLFSLGAMLGITDPAAVTGLLEEVEVCGLDAISTGVTLAWATEALERGILSLRETVEELRFGDPRPYRRAVHRLTRRESGFYFALSRGAEHAARLYGGEEFACVLGQEMAGYATGEAFLAAQALGFRHSHLDSGGYRLDQEAGGRRDEAWVVEHLLRQERERVLLSCMVGCLFGRTAYPASTLATALQSLGYSFTEEELLGLGERIRARRWRLRLAGGFEPEQIRIPERFLRIRNWKGGVDSGYLERILARYAAAIRSLVRADEVRSLGSNGSL